MSSAVKQMRVLPRSGWFYRVLVCLKEDVLACFLIYDAESGNSILLSREKRKLSERKTVFQEPVAMGSNTYVVSLDRSMPDGSLNQDGRGG